MNENTKVCVFIRAYNSEKYIEEALSSVFKQNFGGNIFVKILYDMGSKDDTYNKIKYIAGRLKRDGLNIEIIEHPNASPFRALINYGFKNFIELYDYFTILDYDCFWDDNYISQALSTIKNQGFLFSNPIIINEAGQKIGLIDIIPFKLSGQWFLKNIILWTNFIDANVIFLNRMCAKIVLNKLELLSSKTFDWIFEDWAIAAVSLYNCKIVKMDKPLVYYRVHTSNTTAGNKMAKEDLTNYNRKSLTVLGFKLLVYGKMNFVGKITYFCSLFFHALEPLIREKFIDDNIRKKS